MSDDNALDVLLGALPTGQAGSLASQYGITRSTTTPASSLNSNPTTRPDTSSTTSLLSTSLGSTTPSSTLSSTGSSATSSTTSQTTTTDSSVSQGPAAQSTSPAPAPSAAPVSGASIQRSAGVVAGIIIGTVAAFVLVLALAICLLRRRRRRRWRQNGFIAPAADGGSGSSLLGNKKSFARRKHRTFPEVAWLYDPVRPSSRDREQLPHDSMDSRPRLGPNMPWSSRPSTSMDHEQARPMLPPMAEVHDYTDLYPHLPHEQNRDSQEVQPPDRGSPSMHHSGANRVAQPFPPTASAQQDEKEDADDTISPLLPPPARFWTRHLPRAAHSRGSAHNRSGSGEHGKMNSSLSSTAEEERRRSGSSLVSSSPERPTPISKIGRAV